MKDQPCKCAEKALPFDQYKTVKKVGIDKTNGRFGEVEIKQCKKCGRLWLYYFVEYEAFTRSGRYFMGLITSERAEILTAQEAIPYLNQLEWHFFGGSYFDAEGKSVGKIFVDP